MAPGTRPRHSAAKLSRQAAAVLCSLTRLPRSLRTTAQFPCEHLLTGLIFAHLAHYAGTRSIDPQEIDVSDIGRR
jgi:hypothetical protein